MHSICAFANDIDNWGGGYIIIGIDEENGMPQFPIKGLSKKSIDRINKELLQKCNLIEPRYIPIVEQASYEGKEIIILWIPGGNDRPLQVSRRFSNRKSGKSGKGLLYSKDVQQHSGKADRRKRVVYVGEQSAL